MNLDKLKSDIANNEICVLVNGQPETVDFKQWCKDVADISELHHEDVKCFVEWVSNGVICTTPHWKMIYNQLDY